MAALLLILGSYWTLHLVIPMTTTRRGNPFLGVCAPINATYGADCFLAACPVQDKASLALSIRSARPETLRMAAASRVGPGATWRPQTSPAATHIPTQLGQETSSPMVL